MLGRFSGEALQRAYEAGCRTKLVRLQKMLSILHRFYGDKDFSKFTPEVLFKNMSPADIGEFFAEFAGKMRTKQLARRLAVEAQSRGLKADDISVVVARLYDADEPPTPPTPTPRRR